MEPIAEGSTGVAVEDIQERLANLGYKIDDEERANSMFGPSTATSVARFQMRPATLRAMGSSPVRATSRSSST